MSCKSVWIPTLQSTLINARKHERTAKKGAGTDTATTPTPDSHNEAKLPPSIDPLELGLDLKLYNSFSPNRLPRTSAFLPRTLPSAVSPSFLSHFKMAHPRSGTLGPERRHQHPRVTPDLSSRANNNTCGWPPEVKKYPFYDTYQKSRPLELTKRFFQYVPQKVGHWNSQNILFMFWRND